MIEELRHRIDDYRLSDDNRPLVVDVSNLNDLQELYRQYLTFHKINIFDLTRIGSELPCMTDVYQALENCEHKEALVTGLGSFLKIYGNKDLNRYIHSLLSTAYSSKFIIITYQCSKFFVDENPKLRDKIIVYNEDEPSPSSSIVFIPSEYNNKVVSENGLKNALNKIESTSGDLIYVTTAWKTSSFRDSLIRLEECSSPYDLLCLKDVELRKIPNHYGNNEQWSILLDKLVNNSVETTLKEFINYKDILASIKEWNDKTSFEKWALFLYVKLKHFETGNFAIDYSIDVSENVGDFIKNIYGSIINIDYKEVGFWDKYNDRKKIVKELKDETAIFDYCNYIQFKNENSLYYLTDSSDNEKKLIIQIIDRYSDILTKNKLIDILQRVYPDLYWYIADYKMNDEFLTKYFNEYRYLKVINKLTEDFKNLVDQEALERSFKRRLMRRSEILTDIDYTDSIVYFIDALGVEFLGLIEKLCQDKGLACRVKICRSNLPSTTENNTEFREFFRLKNIKVNDEKGLDNVKHDGKDDYDFDKNKLPLHIVEEFRIINNNIEDIRKRIKSQSIKKAVIVSDHGATRLAILNNDMVREDVESVGEHGGRVCKQVPGMRLIPNAIVENGCCILADYNAFRGGRIGKVEMHGGATLEEVTIPVIEISDRVNTIDIKVITEVIKVSYKTKAVLRFFSSTKITNVIIRINGKDYKAVPIDEFTFEVILDDISKSGDYMFEVWSNNRLISSDNKFTVEKESATTNDLWG